MCEVISRNDDYLRNPTKIRMTCVVIGQGTYYIDLIITGVLEEENAARAIYVTIIADFGMEVVDSIFECGFLGVG